MEALEHRFDQLNLCMERLSDLSSKAIEVSHTEAKDRQSPPISASEVVREAREVSERARECLKRIQAEDNEFSLSVEATTELVETRKSLFKQHAEKLLQRLVELERAQDDEIVQNSDGDNSQSGGDTPVPSSAQASPRSFKKRDLHLPICSTASTPRLDHYSRDQPSLSSLDSYSCGAVTPSPSATDVPKIAPVLKKKNVFSFKQPSSARPSMSVHFKIHDDEDWMRGGSDPTSSQNRPAESTKDANTLYGIFDELQLMVNPGLVEPLSPKANAYPFSPRTTSSSSISCSLPSDVPVIASKLAKKKKKKKSQCRVM